MLQLFHSSHDGCTLVVCSHHTSEARLCCICYWGRVSILIPLPIIIVYTQTLSVTNVNTDLTITTEKLVELFATMEDDYVVDAMIGLHPRLNLPLPKVAEIQWNYHSLSQRKEAYLDLYATSHPFPSWRQIAEVLRCVDLHHQADVVKSTYVQGTRIIQHYLPLIYRRRGFLSAPRN